MLCMHQGHRAPWCTDAACRLTAPPCRGTHRQHETKVDSEAGMLSGLSQKRSIRSNPCWFTEFCKSQCLSHFAAPFIVVQAETSVAESCKEAIIGRCREHREETQTLKGEVMEEDARQTGVTAIARCSPGRPRDYARSKLSLTSTISHF